MLCLLPALEDQEQYAKKAESILKQTESIVGTSEFFGEIWKAMLRTPRARQPAINYLNKRIPVNLENAIKYKDNKEKNFIYISGYTV